MRRKNSCWEVTPLILAGGKSKRMGTNKSFVLFAGKPMIEVMIERIRGVFSLPPILITNSPELYSYLGLEMVEDIVKERGPLGGIHAGLKNSTTQFNFIFGCDMPFLNLDLINYMTERVGEDTDIVIPRYGNCVEPLYAIYSRACLRAIETQINLGSLRIQSFFSQVKISYIDQSEIVRFDPELTCFSNINTKEDLEQAQASWQERGLSGREGEK